MTKRFPDSFYEFRPEPYTPPGGRPGKRVVEGHRGTLHTQRADGSKIPIVAGGRKPKVLELYNAVASTVNLGVGIYTAYHTTRMRSEVSDLHSALTRGLGRVNAHLEAQARTLARIEAIQKRYARQLDQILTAVINSQDLQIKAIDNALFQLRLDEYSSRVRALQLVKRDCVDALANGPASSEDLRQLTHRATDVISWVDSQLQREGGLGARCSRQALVFARLDAEIAKQDARSLVAKFAGQPDAEIDAERRKKRDELREIVRREVVRLLDGVTPWQVLSQLRGQVILYAALYSALLSDLGVRVDDGEFVQSKDFSDSLPDWDTLMPVETKSRRSTPNSKAMSTIADYEWFCSMFQLDSSCFDVHKYKSVTSAQLCARLGTDNVPVPFDTLAKLADPEVWRRYGDWITESFATTAEVRLLPTGPAKPPSKR